MSKCGILNGIFLLKKKGRNNGDRYIGTRVTEEFPSKLGANPEKIIKDASGLWLVQTSDGKAKVAVPYRGYFVKQVSGEGAPDEVFYVEKGSDECKDFLVIPEGGGVIAGELELLGRSEQPEDFRKKEERIAEIWV